LVCRFHKLNTKDFSVSLGHGFSDLWIGSTVVEANMFVWEENL